MKVEGLQKIIKDACREVFREELKEILLEAIKSPKSVIQETGQNNQFQKQTPSRSAAEVKAAEVKAAYSEIMEGIAGKKGFNENLNENQSSLGPIPVNTMSEGSSLPEGDVPMDFIFQLTGKK